MIIDRFLTQRKSTYTKSVDVVIASEKASRSIIKSISWRIIGTIDTIIISWFISGNLTIAISIGSVELGTKMLLYFFHERIWNLIKWGKQ